MEIIGIDGKRQRFEGCLSCELLNERLPAFGGILYRNENFFIMQDVELPIDGFMVIASCRHVEQMTELTDDERADLISLINKTLLVLKQNGVCDEFNIILEEKSGYHFHVWLMPRHKWMIKKFGKVLKNIKSIQEYAINNLKTNEELEKIAKTCELVKRELNK